MSVFLSKFTELNKYCSQLPNIFIFYVVNQVHDMKEGHSRLTVHESVKTSRVGVRVRIIRPPQLCPNPWTIIPPFGRFVGWARKKFRPIQPYASGL